ncbi:type III-B CRISPR module RAMP protein Cmr6 [Hydrogenothermus marinus]|uniref:CRISPR-associated protein Cmr6 n=1 Tax=Hydrogenothermus marinus TaxID=133270 RepID=A0A3M0BKU1_9AQUI|nr:type III-B CRISPR module RAMP protein Cmr6 [Hydrogenothermus marinus]RMA96969.1 CRISPR-associated protein Cmr6 [Hydrogenothermus marinus]
METRKVVPKETSQILKNFNHIDNISLLLNKYLDFLTFNKNKLNANEISFIKAINYISFIKDDEVYNEALKKVFEINYRRNRFKINSKNFEKEVVENTKERVENYRNYLIKGNGNKNLNKILEKIKERQKNSSDCSYQLTTKSRLIIGLGISSVLETSIKLHHIYGIPYIPSSAIKGVLRAYRIWKLANWDEEKYKEIETRIDDYKGKPEENISEEEKKIIEIFGNQNQKGKLIILDAYPEKFEGFDVDIMNPHYPNYYTNDKNPEPPADWQNPTPITFLAIPEGTTFNFYFKNAESYDRDLEKLRIDLQEAFEKIGIGAKTSLGYGILE